MYGKYQCTCKNIAISSANRKSFFNAEKIKPCQCQYHRQPNLPTDFFMKENSKHRHKDYIKGRDKSCFSCGSILNAHLLQTACYKQADSTKDTTDQQSFPRISNICFCHTFLIYCSFCSHIFSGTLSFSQQQNTWQQSYCPDQASHTVKCKWLYIVHPDALGNKRSSPDERRQYQHKCILWFHIFPLSLFFSNTLTYKSLSQNSTSFNKMALPLARRHIKNATHEILYLMGSAFIIRLLHTIYVLFLNCSAETLQHSSRSSCLTLVSWALNSLESSKVFSDLLQLFQIVTAHHSDCLHQR